jgi:hypothetical protein
MSTIFGLSRLLELAGTITWRLNGRAGLGCRRRPVSRKRQASQVRRATPSVEEMEGRIVPTLLGQQLFPADYPWNQNISNAPVAANSAAVIAHIGTSIRIHPDWGDDSPANGSSPLYGIPFNVVHGNTTTKVNVIVDNYPSESDLLPAPIPANAVIEGDYQNGPNPYGPGYGTNQRGDSHLIIWDEDNNIAYEFYGAARPSDPVTMAGGTTGGNWHAAQESVWDMKTDSFRTLGYTSVDAAGLSILAGLARPDEGLPSVQGGQGAINHALRFTLPSGDINPQYIYPASHVVNTSSGASNLPFGARLRLMNTAAVNNVISTLGPEAQIIAHAMQQYGLVLADIGSAMYVTGSSASENASNAINFTWNMSDVSGLSALNASDFEVVNLTPVVTALNVTTGSAGTTITISGQNFSGAAGQLRVQFGSAAATGVTLVDDSHITAVVPSGSGTVNVRVQSGINATDPNNPNDNVTNPIFGYGISAITGADLFTYGVTVPASQLVLSGFPSATTAGSAGTITVTAEDALGNVVKGYTGTVHFTSIDVQAGLPTDYTFVSTDNGVHSFSITLKTAGTQSITATDKASATVTGAQSGITVAAAAASKFVVSGFPTPVTAGTSATVTMTAQDPYGNVSKSYTGTVHFTSSDARASLPADYTFVSADNGVHPFSVTLKSAGTQSLTATDKTTATITGTESGISVAAAAASTLVVAGFPTSIMAGAAGTITVTADDAFGNVASGYAGTVHFTSTDTQASLPANYTFVSADKGSHAFSVTLKTAGSQSVTVTDQSNAALSGTQSGISVTPAVAQLVVSGFPTSATAGTTATITVAAKDNFGNLAAAYRGTVHFTSTDAQAVLPADYQFVSADQGSHAFSITLKTAGSQSVTATDKGNASLTGTESGITVSPGPASQLLFTAPSLTAVAGTLINPAVKVQVFDAFGNLLSGDNSDRVTLTAASGPGSFTSASVTSVTVSGGVASFSNLALSDAGAYTISASTAGLITAATTVHVARIAPPPSWLTAVANNLTHSAEYYTLIVDAAYQRYLGRLPDSTGLAGWVAQMQHGLTDEHLEAGFIGSPEYIQAHGGAGAGWITGMYQNLLGRTPSPAEVNTWLQALAHGESTTAIAYGFAASPEREGQIVSADYQQYLGRTPTAAEVSSWVTVFENGSDTNENVVGGFAGSTEYFHNHFRNAADWFAAAYQAILGLPASQAGAVPSFLPAVANTLTHSTEYYTGIVTAAYQRYLGRSPDSAGLSSWVGQMQQGLSDEHLESAFIGSKEFIQNHGGLGAGWITAMYQGLLGRTPSPAEVNQWLQALANGVSTTTIAYAFAAGREREGQRVTADYQQYLGRTPTAAEVSSWVNDFESGAVTNENVVAGFVGSVEYFQKYNGDAQHWWNQAVQALFGAAGF